MDTPTIRRAVAADAAALTPMMAAFFAMEHMPWREEAMIAAFRRLCDEPGLGYCLLAVDGDDAPLAYVIVTYNYDLEFAGRDAFVTDLYVAAGARRRGLGEALMREAELVARANDVHAFHLMVWPENTAAQELYRRVGFAMTRRALMTKPLD